MRRHNIVFGRVDQNAAPGEGEGAMCGMYNRSFSIYVTYSMACSGNFWLDRIFKTGSRIFNIFFHINASNQISWIH